MTPANMLTLSRFVCVPVVFVAGWHRWWLLCVAAYGLGLVTDAIDGRMARITKTTTPFGRAMDSAADKALVAAALLSLTAAHRLSIWLPFLFVVREFAVFGLRAIRTANGSTVAEISDRLGRLRFFILHAGIIALLIHVHWPWVNTSGNGAIIGATLLAYVTLIHYIVRDWRALYATMKSTVV